MKEKTYHLISTRLFIIAWLTLVALTLSQILGRMVWQLELFSHYTPHGGLVILFASACYPKSFSRLARLSFLVFGIGLLAWSSAPLYLYREQAQKDNLANPIKIAYQNVRIDNPQPSKTLAQLTQTNPDVLLLIEAGGDDWNHQIDALKSHYPVRCGYTNFAVSAIQAFVADKQARCKLLNIAETPTIKITLIHNRIIYGIHPLPPLGAHLAKKQHEFLRAFKSKILKDIKTNISANIMVIGDMNLSAFSPIYRDFVKDSGLRLTMQNGAPTWLPLGISIDQIFTNNNDGAKVKALNWQGSDHRGFLVSW